MKRLKVGLIGLGTFGKLQTTILSQLPNVQLEALSSRTKSNLEKAGKTYNVDKLYTNYKDLIADTQVEAVVIASEASLHTEQALKTIAAGKHLFLEKPPALSCSDVVRIAENAKGAGIFLMIGYILRFEARYAMVKKYMEDNAFGRIAYMSFKRNCSRSWFEGKDQYPHPVRESMNHDIDLALWYAQSNVERVYAKQTRVFRKKLPDVCLTMLTFQNGIVAKFESNWIIPDASPLNLGKYDGTLDSYFEAVGTKMIARIDLLDSGFTVWDNKRVMHPETVLWPEVHGKIEGALRNEIEHFVDCILTGKPSSIASVDDAVYGMRIADAIVESASTQNEIILK